jgi:hypothetical protein
MYNSAPVNCPTTAAILKRVVCTCCWLALLSVLAAEWPDAPATRHAYLEVIVANKTSQNLNETAVCCGKDECTFGIVGAGVPKGYLGWTQTITTNAIVRWVEGRSQKKEQTISLIGTYNPKVPGALTFTIQTTNVTVQFSRIEGR